MLVLTRKSGQSIMIGDEIEITVLEAGAGKVRVGIEAPREVPIFRTEVYESIQAEKEEGSENPPSGEAAKTEQVGGRREADEQAHPKRA